MYLCKPIVQMLKIMSDSTVHSSHHHHHHHHQETFSEIHRRHAFSAQKRNKLIEKVLTIFLTIVCVVMMIFIYWLYSNQ